MGSLFPGDDMLAYGYSPNLNKNSEIPSEGGGVSDFWLKLLLSDYEDDAEYSTKRESFLFHELFVWAPRFIDGVEVVLPGSGIHEFFILRTCKKNFMSCLVSTLL